MQDLEKIVRQVLAEINAELGPAAAGPDFAGPDGGLCESKPGSLRDHRDLGGRDPGRGPGGQGGPGPVG